MATRTFPYSRTVSVRRNIWSSVTVDVLEMRGTRGRLSVRPGIRFISLNMMIVLLRFSLDWLVWYLLQGVWHPNLYCHAIVGKPFIFGASYWRGEFQARAIVSRPRSHKLSTSAHIQRRSISIEKKDLDESIACG